MESVFDKKKILIVDDSEINRSLLSDMLDDEYEIIEAENGMEASAILHEHEHEISLMLLDIMMPVMDGFETLEAMNKNGWIKDIPVIMISAETVPSYVDRAYDLGVQDFINRPFDERTVRRRVVNTILLFAKQKELSHMVMNQIMEKENDNKLMIEILSNIVEFRNGESGLHVLHIRVLTEIILKWLIDNSEYGLSEDDIYLICNASALHDIGKISIASEILNKPGRLTDEEFKIMKGHALEGARLLQDIPMRENEPLIQLGYQICRWHHERFDGRGYPDGLKGEEIPIAAQVVALADVYDALTSKRVYKPAFSHEKAVDMILNGECGVFNPVLLTCLKELSETLEEELRQRSEGQNFQEEALDAVEHMMESGELDVSDRTLKLLEHERVKYQFFAELSQEIQFEYTTTPEMVILSEWGAKYLSMPETILNPKKDDFGTVLFAPKDFEDFLARLESTTPENPMVEEKYLMNINGHTRWSKVVARSMWASWEPPEYTGAIGKIVDIHEEQEKMDRLKLIAAHDSLTGLLNHKAAKSQISAILEQDDEKKYIMIVFDLDHFKMANDTFGHLFGDEVLKYVAETMKKNTRNFDIVARMGGDEFLLFMPYKDEMESLVQRIFNLLHSEYNGFSIKVSMGVSCAKECNGKYDVLFHMADEALYEVKRNGRDNYCFYKKENMKLGGSE
ncbi:diguanylate cyclase (GGDEF) domain-containing protein [Dorea sp. 5-2]|nr:diguanylate cyclase (GGDEF) domain-containing protein [Dorea sp. 5-2]